MSASNSPHHLNSAKMCSDTDTNQGNTRIVSATQSITIDGCDSEGTGGFGLKVQKTDTLALAGRRTASIRKVDADTTPRMDYNYVSTGVGTEMVKPPAVTGVCV